MQSLLFPICLPLRCPDIHLANIRFFKTLLYIFFFYTWQLVLELDILWNNISIFLHLAVLEFICCVILLYLPYNMARFTRQWNRRTKITSISTGKQNKTILASQNTSQVSWSKYKEWTKQWHIYQIHQLCQSIVFLFNLIY